uniref:C-type lectin domain-containing protein n=1 Tax=Mastacembelus armatus TaxID=205130 RepID=A0A3Q3SGN4_9TELE
IDMSYDQAFIAGAVLQGKADAWIGLRRQVLSFRTTLTECVTQKKLHCQCKIENVIDYLTDHLSEKPPPTPGPGDGNCMTGWIPYGRYCYYVSREKEVLSWPESDHACQFFKGHLVSIHSRAEVEFIRNLNYTKTHPIWIGLTRDHRTLFDFSDGWGWTDKTSVGFFNWATGEPNAAFHPGEVGEENCVEMYDDGRWNDNNCLQKRGFACRKRVNNNSLLPSVYSSVYTATQILYIFHKREKRRPSKTCQNNFSKIPK